MKILLLGYCAIVLLGAALLTLPFASRGSEGTSFLDALFTSTSATCVTGLTRFDTFVHWSLFGQIIILILIQIGGIGYMTIVIVFVSFTKRKIGLASRFILQDSIASPQVGGVVKMTKFIFAGSVIIEGVGTLLLALYFCPTMGLGEGLYFSLFHSVSSFCNAGFDLMGKFQPSSSLMLFADNWYVCAVIMALIVLGGLGFFVWYDLLMQKFRIRKCRLQTKFVIFVSVILIFAGMFFILLFELKNPEMYDKPWDKKILSALFQSVTTRTAGFYTIDISRLTQSTQAFMIMLMFIGGSTGSTAGGMKTTTAAVLILSIVATFRRKKSIEAFGRRIEDGAIRTSCCIFVMYVVISFFTSMTLCNLEDVPFISAFFECVSAISTVGVSFGITPFVSPVSEVMLILLMLFGRVGSITMLLAFSSEKSAVPSKLPSEKIQVG